MKTDNKYLAIQNLGILQRQAGVDPEMADLIVAYARLCADKHKPLKFYDEMATLEDLYKQPIHRWLLDKNETEDPRVLSFLVNYGNAMASRHLPVIYNARHLAKKRGIELGLLQAMSLDQRRFYHTFEIPKKNGETRKIMEPTEQLLTMQQWILAEILGHGKPHRYATGFIRGKSIVDNAKPHVGRKVVVRIDLKDFFPSITHRQVRKVFEKFGYPYNVAALLANLCTVDGCLPQGAPTSPALSNLVSIKIDRRFTGLKWKLGFRYSRYADDLIFSSNNEDMPQLIPFIKQVIREEGFGVNEDKVKIAYRGQRQIVTGIVVNDKLNLPRDHVRKLRSAALRMSTSGREALELTSRNPGEHDPENVLRGHISYLRMVNVAKGDALQKMIKNIS